MPVTRSTAAERPRTRYTAGPRALWRWHELAWLLVAALQAGWGLWLVYGAKTQEFAAVEKGLASKQILDLNALGAREELQPALADVFSNQAERDFAVRKIYYASGGLANVGAIARIRVAPDEVAARPLKRFAKGRLVTAEELRMLKPRFVVRRPAQFQRAFLLWCAAFFAAFVLAHCFFSLYRFRGDQSLLPAALLLSGIGLILMVSLRDPVRDTLLFADFAQGAAAGVLVMAAAALVNYERLAGGLSFVPLLASFGLSALLMVFGTGPGTSDAKVNLFGFQPVEIIRLLLVFFLAGYFAQRWDVLRHARETRPKVAALTQFVDLPPLEYVLPVLVCATLSVVFFFLQRDMGPALVFACLFLALYGLARGRAFLPILGLALVAAGFLAGFVLGVPHTVRERVSMWLNPWDNLVHGGDQLAHSLWAFATGGLAGTGLGLGSPQLVPAAHTDLILSALGEELGFVGVAGVFLLYAFLVYKALRIARRAASDYEFFLAAGLAAATVLQILLIAGGALGVLPLSGVVTPLLSYGRTALVANFAVLGILLAISSRGEEIRGHCGLLSTTASPATSGSSVPASLHGSIRAAGVIFGLAGAVVLAKAAYVQVAHADAVMGEGTLVVQADGARRYQYNPRFEEVMGEVPKGAIYDRNGLPLATSDWQDLEKHRAEYRQLSIDIDRAAPRTQSRQYPFGGLMFDLLGDLRTRLRWGASNTSFVERDSARRLRGYDDRPTLVTVRNPNGATERVVRYDYRELVPLVRYRYEPQNPAVRRVLDRARDVHMTIDARLQVRVATILQKQLQQAGVTKGAAVVLDPVTGDLLAAVSLPVPVLNPDDSSAGPESPDNPYLDRARYGLYPPGSTFKVVTAMAALRKDMQLTRKTYQCIRLPDGRVGQYLKGSNRPIRDDIQDKEPHGTVDMERGIVVSCNAYFAQLGTYDVGADPLLATAKLLGISVASPATAAQLRRSLPQASYGQGQVVASPFQMARVAAAVANGGAMPQGRWVSDETNNRTDTPQVVMSAEAAQTLGKFMREVVTSGTGRRAASSTVAVAGKTGTAELASDPSHAWFIGFAPYGSAGRKIAVSVLVENGVYGGTAAAPAAAEIVNAAAQLGLIQ